MTISHYYVGMPKLPLPPSAPPDPSAPNGPPAVAFTKPKLLVFDYDNTLVERNSSLCEGVLEELERLLKVETRQMGITGGVFDPMPRECVKQLRDYCVNPNPFKGLEEVCDDLLRIINPYADDDTKTYTYLYDLEKTLKKCRGSSGRQTNTTTGGAIILRDRFIPGAREMLNVAKHANIPVAIVTSRGSLSKGDIENDLIALGEAHQVGDAYSDQFRGKIYCVGDIFEETGTAKSRFIKQLIKDFAVKPNHDGAGKFYPDVLFVGDGVYDKKAAGIARVTAVGFSGTPAENEMQRTFDDNSMALSLDQTITEHVPSAQGELFEKAYVGDGGCLVGAVVRDIDQFIGLLGAMGVDVSPDKRAAPPPSADIPLAASAAPPTARDAAGAKGYKTASEQRAEAAQQEEGELDEVAKRLRDRWNAMRRNPDAPKKPGGGGGVGGKA